MSTPLRRFLESGGSAVGAASTVQKLASPQLGAPIAPRAPSGSTPLRRYLNGDTSLLGREEEEQDTNPIYRFVSDLPEPLKRTAGGALRGLASALEPLQLPQDAMFAIIAGALDEETTIADRLKGMRFADYLPGGQAPPRPASGEEIFSLLGFDETVSRWAGIAADVLVDPLVFGSWLRVAGKISKIDDLVRLGNKFDYFISPIGMGREVNKALRRSEHMSNFMDARMAAVLSALRDPNSSVLGIRNFGERTANFLEWMFLPKSQVDRIRYGDDAAAAVAEAHRMAKKAGREVPQEAIDLLRAAHLGPEGMRHRYLPQEHLKLMQEYPQAWKRHLESIKDPTVREVIEREIYNITSPGPDKGPRVGLLSWLEGRAGIAAIEDADVRKYVGEAYEAAASSMTPVRTKKSPNPDDLFAATRGRLERDVVGPAREHVGRVARERATAAGLAGQELIDAEAAVVRVFNSYLNDVLVIDAKLGLHMSGLPFVTRQIRARVGELTGNLDLADPILYRMMRAGMKGGQKGLDELADASTGISLKTLLPAGREVVERVNGRVRYRELVAAEVAALGRDVPRLRVDTGMKKLEDIASEAKDIWEGLYRRKRLPRGALPTAEEAAALERARMATRDAAEVLEEATRRLEDFSRVLPTGATPRQAERIMANAVVARDRAERILTNRLAREREILNGVRSIAGGPQVKVMPAARHAGPRRVAMDRIGQLMDEVESVERRLRDSRFARSRNLEDVVEARRRASAAVGIGPEAVAAREAAEAADNLGQIPMAGSNTIAEDIVAARMKQGNLSLEQATRDPITFGELIDGITDMSALPLGDYFEGLMNGHLRRAYALFGDTDDFRRWIDNFKTGRIVPSSMIDEANLAANMPGFEREAALILQYHQALSRQGRGFVLKRSGIAEYLLNSNVEPQRVNGALKALMQSLGPDNGRLRDFTNKLEQMVPQYREALKKYTGEITPRADLQIRAGNRFFDPREQLDPALLENLGEIALARASLTESAEVTRRVLTRQEAFQNIYEVAKSRGLLRNSAHVDQYGARFVKLADSEKMLGGFGGKYVHPYLYEELRKMSAVPKTAVPGVLTRIRSLITGGYLASPAVIAANSFGGLYQGWTMGIDPATMIRRLIETAPEIDRASRGYRSDIVHEIRRNLDMELTTLSFNDFGQYMSRMKLDEFGLGPEGVRRAFDQLTGIVEEFLQRPGFGKFRTRFAGLEGFQMTENWFKVASYKEMKERLIRQLGRAPSPDDLASIEKQAAEFARLVVFDYSELPKSLEFLKNTGLVLFPGFTYFLAGRTINTALTRPGVLAVADRLSEAAANATLNLEDQMALLMGTPEWMREDQGVPMPFSVREGKQGEQKVSVIPMNQLIPTSTILDGVWGRGNPWAQSVAQAGVWGPFMEVIAALAHGEGEAILSGRYGNRVFEADSEGAQKFADIFRFLYNTLAPGFVKKMITANNYGEHTGIIPTLPDMARDLTQWGTQDMLNTAYSFEEYRTGRPDKGWRESVISFMLRSPQVVALDGSISGVRRELRNEQARLGEQLTALRRRANKARSEGDMESFERWADEIRSRQTEFNVRWQEFLAFYRAYEVKKARERRP